MEASSSMLSEYHAKALEARGLDVELATRYGLYTEKRKHDGRCLAITFTRKGKVINHKYRGPDKKFSQDEGAPRSLWNEDCLRDPTLAEMPLIVTEGEFDALAAIQSGFPKSVSVPDGAGSNLDFLGSDELWPLLAATKRVILAADGDDPGQKLCAELARRLGAARCLFIVYPKGAKDLNDVLRLEGERGVRAVIEAAKPYPLKGVFRLSDYPDEPMPETFTSGWINLNPHLRFWRGEFAVITGVPSAGKSLWTLNLLCNFAREHDHRAAIASFEMRTRPFVFDILAKYHGGPRAEAEKWIEDRFLFIDQDPSQDDEDMTIEWLLERAEDCVIRHGIDWLLLDPWNQIDHNPGRDTEEGYQRKAIRQIKRFARAYGVGVFVVAHPTKDIKQRDGSIRRPTGYDIAGSSHWVNAPDHLIVLERPDGAQQNVEVSVLKSRHAVGGTCGSALLRYDYREGRYRAIAKTPEIVRS